MKKVLVLISSVLIFNACGIYNARVSSNSSLLTPPEIDAEYYPEGTVVEAWHKCSVPGPTRRRMLVYLPKGYQDSDRRYPVLYLIHGARGNESAWITKGNVLHYADSLFDCGAAKPCIIVFPNLNHYKDDSDYGNSRSQGAMESFYETDGRAESAFVRDVVDHVDSCFRTLPVKECRAIAGMSIGALQSIYISAWSRDVFGHVGMFSPIYKAPPRHGRYAWFYGHLKDNLKGQFENAPHTYDIEIGRTDFFYPHIAFYRRYLARQGYGFQYSEYPGGHEWYNWEKSFCNFLKLMSAE